MGVWVRIGLRKVERRHRVRGEDVDVRVGHLEAGDHHPHARWREHELLRVRHGMSHGHEMDGNRRRQVGPAVDLHDGNDQTMARRQRPHIEKGHGEVITPHEPTGNLADDDAREDARHAGTVTQT